MKISTQIFLSFFTILVLFTITTYINFELSKEVKENTDYLSRSSSIVRLINRFQRNALNMVSGMRGYLLTGEEAFIQTYRISLEENDSVLRELHKTAYDSRQKMILDTVQSLYKKWLLEGSALMNRTKEQRLSKIPGATSGNGKEDFRLSMETAVYSDLLNQISQFRNAEYSIREERKKDLNQSIYSTRRTSLVLTVASVILGLFIASWLARKISQRIVRMVQMSEAITTGNYHLKMYDPSADELGRLSTSLNRMAEVLNESFSELKRKNEELDEFAHVVSHDLKAPLRGIGNVVSWIEEDHKNELSAKVREYLSLISGRVSRAENLIRGILSYARIDRLRVEKERVDVNDLIEEIKDELLPPKGVSVVVPKPLPIIMTERLMLYQIFSNLISNAIKHHHNEERSVSINFSEHNSHYEFSVKDDGPGIALSHQSKIFRIFQTLQERDNFESTGIGLAIVLKILNSKKETMHVDSELGKGSTFSFTWKKNEEI